MFCPNCGAPVTGRVCEYCGSVMAEETRKEEPRPAGVQSAAPSAAQYAASAPASVRAGARPRKNKWVAFTLCLLLGYCGAHKFYEGKVGMGILYLFTAGLFGIGWLVDMILILCRPEEYAA